MCQTHNSVTVEPGMSARHIHVSASVMTLTHEGVWLSTDSSDSSHRDCWAAPRETVGPPETVVTVGLCSTVTLLRVWHMNDCCVQQSHTVMSLTHECGYESETWMTLWVVGPYDRVIGYESETHSCVNSHAVMSLTHECGYGVATMSRHLKRIGLFCKRAL